MATTTGTGDRQEAFVERVFDATEGTFTVFTIHVGDRLGYYDALVDEALTARELAERTDTDERYAREWLEQQTVAGILAVENETVPADERRFRLPAEHVEPLTDPESFDYVPGLAQLVVGTVGPVREVVEAYRTGEGVPFAAYAPDLHEGQARMNRPAFLRRLADEWLASIPDLDERLRSERPARVADVGCGFGYSSIGIARGYPNVRVDGYDLDGESVERARENVAAAGLSDRVTIHRRDVADPSIEGEYDLVLAFECVHDMADPVGALATMRRLAGEDGVVLVVDERTGDSFTAQGTEIEWFLYGFSVLHCLPVGRTERPSAATGTVMRTDTLREYAREAGFDDVEVLPIEDLFFRFYRTVP